MPKLKFTDCIDIINREVEKRRSRWNLKAIAWMDFDDVSQIVKIHLNKKWSKWNQNQSLEPWLNRVITHQICNLVRNNYSNVAKPCLKCPDNMGDELCSKFKKQCSLCPLYKKWEKSRKYAHNIKLPVTIEHHLSEFKTQPDDDIDIMVAADVLHQKMKVILRPLEWRIYYMVYIQNRSDDWVANKMGYKTGEAGRRNGYKRIRQLKRIIISKVKKILERDGCETTIYRTN